MKVMCMKIKEFIEKVIKVKKWIMFKWIFNNFGGNIFWNYKLSSYLIILKENMIEIL